MGILYKDLKAGTYYKGQSPTTAVKFFIYVEQIAPHSSTETKVTIWESARKTVGSKSWTQKKDAIVPNLTDTHARRAVTPAEVQQDGVSLVPLAPSPSGKPAAAPAPTGLAPPPPPPVQTPKPPPPPPSASTTFSTSPNSASAPATTRTGSAPPSKPPALRKNGEPKGPVKGNSTSPTCLCCGGQTKPLVLMSFSTLWCPDCEN